MRNLWHFIVDRGKWFLLPVVVVVLFAGGLILLSSHSIVSSFIYTVF